MSDILRELERLDKEIKNAEKDISTEEGKVSAYMETLEKEYGLTSIVDAEAELHRLTDEKVMLDGQINEKFSTLKEQYNW